MDLIGDLKNLGKLRPRRVVTPTVAHAPTQVPTTLTVSAPTQVPTTITVSAPTQVPTTITTLTAPTRKKRGVQNATDTRSSDTTTLTDLAAAVDKVFVQATYDIVKPISEADYNKIGLFRRGEREYECLEQHVHIYVYPTICPTCSYGVENIRKVRMAVEVALGVPLRLTDDRFEIIGYNRYICASERENCVLDNIIYVKVGGIINMFKHIKKSLLEWNIFPEKICERILKL